jgi:hypothetical protein
MACCGRQARAYGLIGAGTAATARPASVAVIVRSDIVLRYQLRTHIMVRGPVTGRSYTFSAGQPNQRVDPRDALALLRTRYFTRV